uniref:Uncharacterized protein n=1 Tax=Romanomermis culicivorax TaxID=13658 RepID=A0A915J8Z1_ROMCU
MNIIKQYISMNLFINLFTIVVFLHAGCRRTCAFNSHRSKRVISNKYATANSVPWMVMLKHDGEYHCGAALVNRPPNDQIRTVHFTSVVFFYRSNWIEQAFRKIDGLSIWLNHLSPYSPNAAYSTNDEDTEHLVNNYYSSLPEGYNRQLILPQWNDADYTRLWFDEKIYDKIYRTDYSEHDIQDCSKAKRILWKVLEVSSAMPHMKCICTSYHVIIDATANGGKIQGATREMSSQEDGNDNLKMILLGPYNSSFNQFME